MAGYLVKYGSSNLYVAGSETYAIHGAKLSMKTDAVSQFQFTMPPTHPLRNTIALRSGTVRVWFDDVLLFTGYVTRAVETITGELVITCSSDLAMLADVHVRLTDPDGFTSNEPFAMTGRDLFAYMIAVYNNKVASARRFTIGHNIGANDIGPIMYGNHHGVEVSTTTPATVLETISRSILDPYGCVLKVWYEDGTRYIGLYTAAPDTNSQRIQFGENMKSLEFDTSDDDLYTGCYAIGGTGTDYSVSTTVATFHMTQAVAEEGTEFHIDAGPDYEWATGTDEKRMAWGDIFVISGISFKAVGGLVNGRIDLVAVNDEHGRMGGSPKAIPSGTAVYYKGHNPGYYKKFTATLEDVANGTYQTDYTKSGPIVYDTAAVSRYGLRTFALSEDIYYAPRLLNRAIELLKQKVQPTYTLTVDAVDMALYNPSYSHLIAGQRVRVVSVPHNIDLTMQVTQSDLDLDNPANTTYTLGAYKGSVTRMVRGNVREIDSVREALQAFKLDVVKPSDLIGFR